MQLLLLDNPLSPLSVYTVYRLSIYLVLNQSKNFFQAEIDSSCEFIDFLRFNAYFAQEIYSHQPASSAGVFNRFRYRPLEGFVYAISPFNFTAIAGNLSCAPGTYIYLYGYLLI